MKTSGDGFLERMISVLTREKELIVELQAIAAEKLALAEEFQDHINGMRLMTDRLHSPRQVHAEEAIGESSVSTAA